MFDDQLASHQFLVGDKFTIADITLGIALDFARQVKVVDIPTLPNLERWHAAVSRPAKLFR